MPWWAGAFMLFSGALGFSEISQEPSSAIQLCHASQKAGYFKRRLAQAESRIAFRNGGGLANGGICWWHSRFQRKAVYLSAMRSDLPRPTRAKAKEIIRAIKDSRGLVEIPGYQSFEEFTYDYADEVRGVLEAWQRTEGFFQFAWINGLSGQSSPGPDKMQRLLENIRAEVQDRGRISFVHLQIPGITNHAWLVSQIQKIEMDWTLQVVDSNFPSETRSIEYRDGDKGIYDSSLGTWLAPYLAEQDEIQTLEKIVRYQCGQLKANRRFRKA